ncbi:DUF6339 family protein [Ornithinibacillus halophilus]|uniref:Uncharacterized protein n=1 Tax=Ornithinibacillus halophilus TaxID=930117 RepID=A0A1M5KTM0_9BACI|nr:DUF6339 family protein [Ornithinibacillus halophilus]SHG56107.1 hypothetical protein SAMN05216225_104114 [Ornithinibacillus halophilus]
MKLKFISEETLMDLRTNYSTYKDYYYTKDNFWFDNYFSEPGRVIESKIEFDMPELNYHEDYSVSDRENVKKIYDAFKHLNLSQATQERLWSGLAHTQFRDFSYYRLKNELENKNDTRINTGMFFKNSKKRSLFVHVLARLWWVGYMTYDETNEKNPYWLTEFFCEKDFSARSVVFFASNFTSNRNITKGILKTLLKWQELGIPIKRDHFVQANKYLNVVGGAMILDMLTVEEVEEMVDSYLKKYYGMRMEAIGQI